jgi:DNA-binding beta-propeller fold protein YncE
MNKSRMAFVLILVFFTIAAAHSKEAPVTLEQTFKLPADVKGRFDHFGIDLKNHRLFATPEDYHALLVLDYRSGKILQTVRGIEKPHAVVYREDIDRIYVTDGEAGMVRVIDGKSYKIIKSVAVQLDADAMSIDPFTKLLYVVSGGKDVKMTYSTLSVVDSTAGEKLADIKVDGDTLEVMSLENSSRRLYLNNRAKNEIEVIDRDKRAIVETWPVTLGKKNVSMAYDEANHRLFVGCRSGQIVVFDTRTGKELQALKIAEDIDDLHFDPHSKLLFAACGAGSGSVDLYRQVDPDHYESAGQLLSGPGTRNGRFVPELGRYFLAVPQHDNANAEIRVYKVP